MGKVAGGSSFAITDASASGLMGCPPRSPIISPENQVLRRTPSRQLLEKRPAFTGKDNVARLTGLREPDGDRSGRCVEVGNAHPDQLAITAPGYQRAAN